MFKKALQWKLTPQEAGNPLESVAEPEVNRRERLLTGGEIGALLKTLDAAETDGTEYLRLPPPSVPPSSPGRGSQSC